MKKPDDIKEALRKCIGWNSGYRCGECRYWNGSAMCKPELCNDAIAYIEQLEERIILMLIQMRGDCGCCKHKEEKGEPCISCSINGDRPNWEYEGLPEVKSK